MFKAKEIDARDKSVQQVINEIKSQLQGMADRALNHIVDNMIIPEMRDYINTEWYREQGGSPFYTSLGEMSKIYKKVKISAKDHFIVLGYATDELPLDSAPLTTFFDRPRGIQKFAAKENYWPSYISIVDGEDMREDMPYVIEYGWDISGLISTYLNGYDHNVSRERRQGIYAHSYLEDFLETNFVKLMRKEFENKGFKVIR